MKANDNGHLRMANVANDRSPLQPASRQARRLDGLLCGLLCGLFYVTGAARAALPEPQDIPYPGVIRLHVDATDLEHRVFRVTETVPVTGPARSRALSALAARQPRSDRPDPVAGGAGRSRRAPARRLEWQRDPLNMIAFHLDVPAGVSELELRFQFVTPTTASRAHRGTPDLLGLQWEKALLYPAGHYARRSRSGRRSGCRRAGSSRPRAGRVARRRSRAVRAAEPRAAGRFAAVRRAATSAASSSRPIRAARCT